MAHFPQPIHLFSSITALHSDIDIALVGQILTQFSQPTQSEVILAIPIFVSCFSFNDIFFIAPFGQTDRHFKHLIQVSLSTIFSL